MATSLAVLTRDPNLMRCELRRLREKAALAPAGERPGAIGLGYVHGSEVLLRKKPGSMAPADLYELGKDIESDAILFHADRTPAGSFKDENSQPFRYRRWLFAHDGAIEQFAGAKAAIIAELPDFLRRQVKGETDSELAFMAFLMRLPATSRTEDADLPATAAGKLLGETARALEQHARAAGASRPSALNLFATNGRVLAAVRLGGGSLHYALYEGITRCGHCGLTEATPDTNPLVRSHRLLKSVAVARTLLGPNGWIEVPEAHAVTVGRNLEVQVAAI